MKKLLLVGAAALVLTAFLPDVASAQRSGGMRGGGGFGGFHGGMMGGGFRGGMGGGGFRGAMVGGGFRGGMGGGFSGRMGGGFRSAMVGGGFRGAGLRSGFVGSRSFAFRPGFAPRFARFNRFGHRRFAFAAVPFAVGVGLYGGSCWTWQPTPWGWQRVWACDYDYGYYGYY